MVLIGEDLIEKVLQNNILENKKTLINIIQ